MDYLNYGNKVKEKETFFNHQPPQKTQIPQDVKLTADDFRFGDLTQPQKQEQKSSPHEASGFINPNTGQKHDGSVTQPT